MLVGGFGQLVEFSAREFTEAIVVRLQVRAHLRLHVELQEVLKSAIDAIEIHPAAIEREMIGAGAWRRRFYGEASIFGLAPSASASSLDVVMRSDLRSRIDHSRAIFAVTLEARPMEFGTLIFTKPQRAITDPKLAEDYGYSHAWIPDSHMIWGDVWACMALAAVNTTRIKLATGVAIATNRIPPVTVEAIGTINELAPGRVVLGFGTGHTGRRVMGLPPVKHAVFREEVRVIHDLLAERRGDLQHRGNEQEDSLHPSRSTLHQPRRSDSVLCRGQRSEDHRARGRVRRRMRHHRRHHSRPRRDCEEASAGGRRARQAQAAGEVSDRHVDARMRVAAGRGPRFAAGQDDVRAVGDGESARLRGGLCARRIAAGAGAPGVPGLHGLRVEDEDAARRALPRSSIAGTAAMWNPRSGSSSRPSPSNAALSLGRASRWSSRFARWRRPGYRRFSSIHRWTASAIVSARSRARSSSVFDLTPSLEGRGIRTGS